MSGLPWRHARQILTVLALLTFNDQKFRGSRDSAHTPFWENFKGVIYGMSLETRMSNLKSVALAVLELMTFNRQKFGGHVTLPTPPFGKIFKGSCTDCPWNHARQI